MWSILYVMSIQLSGYRNGLTILWPSLYPDNSIDIRHTVRGHPRLLVHSSKYPDNSIDIRHTVRGHPRLLVHSSKYPDNSIHQAYRNGLTILGGHLTVCLITVYCYQDTYWNGHPRLLVHSSKYPDNSIDIRIQSEATQDC